MAGVIKKPEALNLSGNLNEFVLSSSRLVSFTLKKGEDILLQQSYEPGPDNLIRVDVKDVVESQLSYTLNAGQSFYVQKKLAETFVAVIDGASHSFRVIRSGVANLADTAGNWLKLHFLTWQPRVKAVTYYSPEWLTYYAVEECTAKLKATYPNKSTKIITLGTCVAGYATTINLQYSIVAGRLGNTYPSYYEVWTEKAGGTKLSESQVYAFSDPLSEDEGWYLFENSLGGLDTFRAYGSNNLNAEHEHNIAEFGEIREEYQVDTQRKYVKNTGYLDEYSRRWLLDFFPSKAKFVYEATAIRKIVVTESNVTYISKELPSSYTFTWQMAEVSSFLNLIKNANDIPDNLVAPDLSSPDFILPPRLVEFPRVTLSEGVLIPAFDPFNPKSSVTTYGAIHNAIKNAVIKELEDEIGDIGGGNNPGGDCNVEIIESTDDPKKATNKNLFSALASLAHFLRKDAPDTAEKLLTLLEGAEFGEFESGMIAGKGGKIWANGHAELMSLLLRGWLEVPEIRYNRVQVVGGELWVTDGAKFDTVSQSGNLFDVKIKLEEGELVTFWVGDILKGVYHDKSTGGKFKGFRTLWFRVTAVNQDNQTITVASRYSDDPKYNPVQFLEVARIGSFTEESRQRSILIDSKDNCITFLDHVNTWDITPNMEVCWLGRKDRTIPGVPSTAGYNAKLSNIIMSGKIFQYDEISGSDYLVPIDKGTYVSGLSYAYYDRVSAPGGLWLCVNETGTNSAPTIDNPDWLLQVSNGTSLTPAGNWNSVTKYSKGMIVYLDGDSFVFTSDTPSSGVRPRRNPGGFLATGGKLLTTGGKRLYTGDPFHPWQLLAEAGKDGFSIIVQYSTDKINWHDKFNPEADKYMRQLQKDGAWTDAMQIVGEDGQESPYTSFQFSVNSSLVDAPTSGWQDAPPFVERGQYLWLRSGLVIPPASVPESWTAVRIGGATGDKGINYISDNYSPYSAYKEGDVVPFNGGKIYCKKDNTGQTPVPFLSTGGKLLKTGNFYLLHKPLSINTINSEYWEVFVDKPVKEEVEQTFTTYFVGSQNVTPPTPILTGNSLGWSTNVPASFNWVSQKRATSIAGGSWSRPVRMTAEDGKDGLNATTRWLTSTTSVVRFNSIGNPAPASVIVSCKRQTGILPVEACTDLYLVYRIYADTRCISQSNPSKVSSVTLVDLRRDGVYYVRAYEKLTDAQAWNGNFTSEFTITHANDGEQGQPGITGASPRIRGIWDKSVSDYAWNKQWRDIIFVTINGVNQQYVVKAEGTVPANVNPTSEAGKSYWEPAQQFKFIATDLLLADKIKGDMIDTNTLIAKNVQTSSSGNRIIIDPEERCIRMINSNNQEVCKLDFYLNNGYSGPKMIFKSFSNNGTVGSTTEITGQEISVMDANGVNFFAADSINQKIWINAGVLPQGRDAAYPREVYMDGELIKVRRV